ncbi:ATP-dependent DNA helicase RecG [Marinagarivorans cellulosilyticus]|uniref:ATP-dependent DNA helicase RecG n=2 Tax=Marinagarivorans cellulosilyticus TaxID=2721545 RepID=A0AAN1WHZ6_9GAMM|nr:ATP-dependent DNA helicase RecG [Marinagarivorans cellulosilyticus]
MPKTAMPNTHGPVPLHNIPVSGLKGVGDKLAATLAKLGLNSVQDLLFHLPARYADRTRIADIAELQALQPAVIQGAITSSRVVFGKKRSLVVNLADDTGQVVLRFYFFTAAQQKLLSEGNCLRCYGEPRPGALGLEMYHPEYQAVQSLDDIEGLEDTLTPVYPLTDGLSQKRLRTLMLQALDMLDQSPPNELLPVEVSGYFDHCTLSEALHLAHNPPADADINSLMSGTHNCLQRLAFEELLAHNLTVQQTRLLHQQDPAPSLPSDDALKQKLLDQLPFKPTGAQQRVLKEIEADLSLNLPMHRLVQGDVGSGKTLVAALSALSALANGYQAALVAPTEILAEQHRNNFQQWLSALGFEVVWLAGKVTASQKRKALEKLASGEAHMAVGTHALFEDNVLFKKLGLVIIDEQHRFGVQQRLSLRKKGGEHCPHQLVMTATPIPRTLAMTAYADLELSIIDELPPGRTPVNTVMINQNKRPDVIARVRAACAEGQQAYWVCTLVEDSETLAAAAAEKTCELLREAAPELAIGLVHGRLKSKEKDEVMAAFKAADLHLLVATTVIEVGVDVPNASLMIIENPERLGLAQLHQIRGRVGRGQRASHCVLLYGHPLSKQGRSRLEVLRQSNDGFVIAEKDLELRGPGELLGTQQTGDMHFRLANLQRDAAMIERIHGVAKTLLQHHPDIVKALVSRWFNNQQEYVKA